MRAAFLLSVIFLCSCTEYQKLQEVPDELMGNWFDVFGSEYWKYGIEKSFLIAENRFWDYQEILQNDHSYEIILTSGDHQKRLKLELIDSLTLSVNEDGKVIHTVTNRNEELRRMPINQPITRTNGPVNILGYIEGYSKYSDSVSAVTVTYSNLYLSGIPLEHYAEIDSLGRFQLTFEKLFAQDIMLSFNGVWQYLFAVPGDTLTMYMDADLYGNEPQNTHFMGEYSDICYDITNHRTSYLDVVPSWREQQSKKLHLGPQEYKSYRNEFLEKELIFIDEYCSDGTCSEVFRAWFIQNSKYNNYRELMKYPMFGVNTLEEYKEKFYPYETYYSFLDSVQFDDPKATISSRFGSFIHALNNMMIRHSDYYDREYFRKRREKITLEVLSKNETDSDKTTSLIQAINTGDFSMTELQLEDHPLYEKIKFEHELDLFNYKVNVFSMVENNWLRDLLIGHLYYNRYVRNKSYDMLDAGFEIVDQRITNPQIKDELLKEYQALKIRESQLQQIRFSEDLKMSKANSSGEEFLKKIAEKYSDHVIYIDFWATWCGPCITDMKQAPSIKQHFKDRNVAFVYLCSNSNESMWKKRLKELELEGVHYFLANNLTTDLYNKFEIVGIPRYILIDKKGRVVDENAPSPSHGDELLKSIEQLL